MIFRWGWRRRGLFIAVLEDLVASDILTTFANVSGDSRSNFSEVEAVEAASVDKSGLNHVSEPVKDVVTDSDEVRVSEVDVLQRLSLISEETRVDLVDSVGSLGREGLQAASVGQQIWVEVAHVGHAVEVEVGQALHAPEGITWDVGDRRDIVREEVGQVGVVFEHFSREVGKADDASNAKLFVVSEPAAEVLWQNFQGWVVDHDLGDLVECQTVDVGANDRFDSEFTTFCSDLAIALVIAALIRADDVFAAELSGLHAGNSEKQENSDELQTLKEKFIPESLRQNWSVLLTASWSEQMELMHFIEKRFILYKKNIIWYIEAIEVSAENFCQCKPDKLMSWENFF